MQDGAVDKHRRRFLTTTATVVGGAGVIASSIPFISALNPSDSTAIRVIPFRAENEEKMPVINCPATRSGSTTRMIFVRILTGHFQAFGRVAVSAGLSSLKISVFQAKRMSDSADTQEEEDCLE